MSLSMFVLLVFLALSIGAAGAGNARVGCLGWSPAAATLVALGVVYFADVRR